MLKLLITALIPLPQGNDCNIWSSNASLTGTCMMNKYFKKKLLLVGLLLSLFVMLGACSKNNEQSKPHENLRPFEQFETASQASRPNLKELEMAFGRGASWEMGGAPFGGEVTNEYEFMLKLPQIGPIEQSTFDEIKVKAQPFTDKLLDEMKKVGIEHPVVNLKILDENKNQFKGSEHLTTTYRLTK